MGRFAWGKAYLVTSKVWGKEESNTVWERTLWRPNLSVISSPSYSFFTLFLSYFSPRSTDFDANNIFKAFFGGPGGFSFEGGYVCCSLKSPGYKLTQ